MSLSLTALIDTRVASGAIPSMPMSLWLAAIMPAVCVPWAGPPSIGPSTGLATPLTAQETDRLVSTRPTRSGCVSSMRVSMTPTVTGARVTTTAAASLAPMASAPQFVPDEATGLFGPGIVGAASASGASAAAAGAFAGAAASGAAASGAAASGAAASAGGGSGFVNRSMSGTAATRVGPIEWTLTPAFARAAARSGANEADSLWAKRVPNCG